MAEVVHRNLEAMVPQLEELETSGIFSHEEIRTIIKFRRNHEYSMVRRPAHKEDFLSAIQYELHLDLLRKHRKKRLRVTGTGRDADYGIGNRIHGLFRRALKKFKGDLKLWLQYIEFAKTSNHKQSLARIYGRALAVHPSSTTLWVMAAKFQFETMKDMSSARSLLQQGLRANDSSHHLWLEYLRMELLHTDKVRKRREVLGLQEGEEEEDSTDDFLSYKVAEVVFQQAIKSIPNDVQFRLSFLPIHQLFSGTEHLQGEVYKSLRRDFPCCPAVWEALARRPWAGVQISTMKASQLAELEAGSEELYEEGLSVMRASDSGCSCDGKSGCGGAEPDASTATLWAYYFKWASERFEEAGSLRTLKKKAEQRLVSSFQEACSSGELTVQTYEDYVRTLTLLSKDKEAELAMGCALRVHPSSAQLWLLKMERLGGEGSREEEELEGVCRAALQQVTGKDSLGIWQNWLDRIMECSQHSHVEEVFESALSTGCNEVTEPIGVLYLEWGFKSGGLSKARRIYQKLMATTIPVPYSLYEKCLDLEEHGITSGVKGGMRTLRELYEKAIRDYGRKNIELWLKYIAMELHTKGGDVGKVGTLHWRAMKTLEPSLTSSFMEQYSLLYTVQSGSHS